MFSDGKAVKAKLKLLWIGMGTEEPDPSPGAIGAFRKMLDEAGVKHVYFESPGTAHEWQTWRAATSMISPQGYFDETRFVNHNYRRIHTAA